ncbi:hypothetical protein F4679DRAFT_568214 [Xylaria curta]|nr:hypothetical protein F4679DRAFT_568214 [Xylaria curta]
MVIRLIEVKTLHLQSFIWPGIPEYAILSHTWERDWEVTFQEMTAITANPNHPAARKSGYKKILMACQAATNKGIKYVWVDTCCIDKTSSSELSEAINSMYQWYQNAKVCFAFLADLNPESGPYESTLPQCRWFTRGWCLQELIAPQHVEFFDVNWKYVGSKAEMACLISEITQIDAQVLIDNNLVSSVPVARRMSWAAKRESSLVEDTAYCLLGIFDVNMPMLYGEGPKAFMRLQQEIIKTSNDLSIFAFLCGPGNHSLDLPYGLQHSYCPLFATSPKDFFGCGDLVDTGADIHWNDAFALTNKGLYFRRAKLQVDILRGSYNMSLNCRTPEVQAVTMYLQKVGPGLFARYNDDCYADIVDEMDSNDSERYYAEIEEVYIITDVTSSTQLQLEQADEHAVRFWSRKYHLHRVLQAIQRAPSSDRWDAARLQFLTKGERLVGGYWKVFPRLLRRRDETEPHDQFTGTCYLVCGVERTPDPQAWVRLYSEEEWKTLEARLGIIRLPDIAPNPLNISHQSARFELSSSLTITATIKSKITQKKAHFILELNFNNEHK